MTETESASTPTVAEVFALLASEGQVPALRRTSGTFEFDFDDGASWFLALDHGTPSIQPRVDHPTCTVHCHAKDFVEIAEGKRNMVTAFFSGDVSCTGSLAFALTFRHLVPVAA